MEIRTLFKKAAFLTSSFHDIFAEQGLFLIIDIYVYELFVVDLCEILYIFHGVLPWMIRAGS